jgi:hypothetical protein
MQKQQAIAIWTLATSLAMAALGCSADESPVTVESAALTATPAFVQVNAAVPQSALTAVPVRFNAAQTAGNFIVAIVG